MRCLISILLVAVIYFVGCSREGHFDPTLDNDGFTGITYRDERGMINGTIDRNDWNMHYGNSPYNYPGLKIYYYVGRAHPNPSCDSFIIDYYFRFPCSLFVEIIDDMYRVLHSEIILAGYPGHFVWNPKNYNGNQLPYDIYRVTYKIKARGDWEHGEGDVLTGWGDVWYSDYKQ